MPWTNVAKPTGANWTRVNTYLPGYDDGDTSYDDSDIFYNGLDTAAWTDVAKPSGGSLIEVGLAFGTLGMTYSVQVDASPWNLISKPLD